MSKYIPVDPDKWAEMVQALAEVKSLKAEVESKDRIIQDFATNIIRLGNECRDHALEVKRLKAELTDLKSTADRFEVENSILMKETKRLKDEVDSLMTNPTSRLLRAEREENARLKAEVERLTSDIQMEKENEDRLVREWQKANNEVYGLQRQVAALIDDQTRLKAEVEFWKSASTDNGIACNERANENQGLENDIARLKAEVERLTKAGDEMALNLTHIGWNICVEAWNAAKEGKQS